VGNHQAGYQLHPVAIPVQLIPQNFPPFLHVVCQAWQNFSSEDGYGPWQNAPAGKSLPKAASYDTPGAGESLAEALEASHLWGSSIRTPCGLLG